MSSSCENKIALIKQCLHVSLRKHIMYVTFCFSLSCCWICPKGDENIARKRDLYRHSNVKQRERDSEVESASINTLPVMMRTFVVRSFVRSIIWLNSDRATTMDARGVVFVPGMFYPRILIEIDLCTLMHVYSTDEYLLMLVSDLTLISDKCTEQEPCSIWLTGTAFRSDTDLNLDVNEIYYSDCCWSFLRVPRSMLTISLRSCRVLRRQNEHVNGELAIVLILYQANWIVLFLFDQNASMHVTLSSSSSASPSSSSTITTEKESKLVGQGTLSEVFSCLSHVEWGEFGRAYAAVLVERERKKERRKCSIV